MGQFTLALQGFIRGRPDILPGKVPNESIGVANTCERQGEAQPAVLG
jgi:hypothetical protein